MKRYLLILRDHEVRWPSFSPEEQQAVIERFNAWNQALREEERLFAAGKLTADLGSTLRRRGEEMVVDGPFSEAKEAVGGFFCILAEDQADAERLARDCPLLSYGGSVEVRELAGLIDSRGRVE